MNNYLKLTVYSLMIAALIIQVVVLGYVFDLNFINNISGIMLKSCIVLANISAFSGAIAMYKDFKKN